MRSRRGGITGIGVCHSQFLSIFSWRDHRLHVMRSRLLNDGIIFVDLVGNQALGRDTGYKSRSLLAICLGHFCSNNSDYVMRTHDQITLFVLSSLLCGSFPDCFHTHR